MKIINFRPIFYSFIFFCLALSFAGQIFSGSILHIVIIGSILAASLFLCLYYKRIKRLAVIFLSFCIGLGYFYIGIFYFTGKNYTTDCQITGVVSVLYDYEDYKTIVISSVVADGNNQGNILVNVSGSGQIAIGSIVAFTAKPQNVKLFELGEFNSFCYTKNITHTAWVNINDMQIEEGNLDIVQKMRKSFREFITGKVSTNSEGLIMSVLFGDRTTLDKSVKEHYTTSGIIHVISISGLHVSFLVAVVVYILNKLKVKRKTTFVIVFCLLILYCFMCQFESPVIRSAIMSTTILLAGLIGKKYDNLNALALSGFIILLVKPLYIFDAAFLLSYFSVFCIFTLNRPVENLLTKLHIPPSICKGFSVILGVQLGILPVMAIYYSNFSLLAVFTNFVCIPIFETAYILLVACLPLLILPIATLILGYLDFLFELTTKIATLVSGNTWAMINLFKTSFLSVVLFYISVFLVSKYFMVSMRIKTCAVCFVMSLFFLVTGIISHPNSLQANIIGALTSNKEQNYIFVNKQKVIVVGGLDDLDKLMRYLSQINIYYIDYFIYTKTTQLNIDNSEIVIKNIICYDDVIVTTKISLINLLPNQEFEADSFSVKFVDLNNGVKGANIIFDDYSVYFANNLVLQPYEEYNFLHSVARQENLILCGEESAVQKYLSFLDFNMVLTNKAVTKNSVTYIEDNWTFNVNNDTLMLRSLD